LWVTAADPAPETNGQYMYSGRMIQAAAEAGATIDVLCVARDGSTRRDGQKEGAIRWWLTEGALGRDPKSFLSSLPNVAYRTCTPPMRERLERLLERDSWDWIVLDGISVGWAMGAIRRRYPATGP